MRFLSTKAFFGWVAAGLFVVGLAGIVYKYAEQRERMRVHAAVATGGDPSRGEAMFIQYGCGSCHALKNVRNATGMVGPPLDGVALREIIGGHRAQKTENMERRSREPQNLFPGGGAPCPPGRGAGCRGVPRLPFTPPK